MKVLVLNCGSSSVKYKLFEMASQTVIAQGGIEKIGLKDSFLKLTLPSGEKKIIERSIPEHKAAIEMILEMLQDKQVGVIRSLNEIEAVGHRVVHGGEKFNQSVLVDGGVMRGIESCIDMAPLHNPANLLGIRTIAQLLPSVPQVAVFDTAFHQTLPDYAYIYGIPYELYQKYGVRRYGFHGTSHRYVSARAAQFLGLPAKGLRMITCHIGNGGSITAVKDGKSVDTSMGFTPLEGLLMGTRSGDIDAGAVSFLMDKEKLDTTGISNLLNKKSGLAGVSGVSSDMRDIDAAVAEDNKRARLALESYKYRIVKYIGAYAAVLGGVDVLVFTGGVGENQIQLRRDVVGHLAYLGAEIDDVRNNVRGEDALISSDKSKVKVVVIPTDEELMIASDTQTLVNAK